MQDVLDRVQQNNYRLERYKYEIRIWFEYEAKNMRDQAVWLVRPAMFDSTSKHVVWVSGQNYSGRR